MGWPTPCDVYGVPTHWREALAVAAQHLESLIDAVHEVEETKAEPVATLQAPR